MEDAATSNTDIDSNGVDRISTLPHEILSRILSSLELDLKSAVKTCVLSKAWRYSWCNRSRLVFMPDPTLSLPVLDKILQSYCDRSLRLEHFALCASDDFVDADEVDSLLHKWIPILVQGVEMLALIFNSTSHKVFLLPSLSLILESDNNIRDLCLLRCGFRSATSQVRVGSKRLQTLWLYDVYVPEEILDSILSNCPSIKDVNLLECKGFKGVKLSNNKQLTNLFCFQESNPDVTVEIEDHIQTLETIEIEDCLFSVSRHKPFEFARLKRLSLTRVKLSTESFSCNLHRLEELKLDRCSGIKEFKLSSRSMKRLSINNVSKPLKATIDAPSMVMFIYDGNIPESISFTTTPDEWKSNINSGTHIEPPHRFNELYGLLKALSQSEISLTLDQIEIDRFQTQLDHIGEDSSTNEEAKHVAVEHFTIRRSEVNVNTNVASFLYRLFHVLRPNFIHTCTDTVADSKNTREVAALLLEEREKMQSDDLLQRVLEGVNLQVLYQNQSEWKPVEHTSFAEVSNEGGNIEHELRIHLKWRD